VRDLQGKGTREAKRQRVEVEAFRPAGANRTAACVK
jgi:hypothetical protein